MNNSFAIYENVVQVTQIPTEKRTNLTRHRKYYLCIIYKRSRKQIERRNLNKTSLKKK